MKDNKYWVKRKKNNESAKMSREAQRIKGDFAFYFATIFFFKPRDFLKIFMTKKNDF